MVFPFPFRPKFISSAYTLKAITLNTDGSGLEGYSFRLGVNPLAFGGTQIRCTLGAHSTLNSKVDHVSVGIRSAGTVATVVTPVELLFSGASGCTVPAGGTLTSDWANLTYTTSDSLLLILDYSATLGNYRAASGTGLDRYYKAAAASYNVTNPAGFTLDNGTSYSWASVEGRN